MTAIAPDSPADETGIGNWSCITTSPGHTLDLFEQVRGGCPVGYSNEDGGFHIVVNYADVKHVMLDYETFSSEPHVLRPTVPRDPIPPLETDPPLHTEWRRLLNQAIRPDVIAKLEPLIRSDINTHIDAIAEQGSCDIVPALTEPVPVEAICRLIGLDDHLAPIVRENALGPVIGDPDELVRRDAVFTRMMLGEIRKRRANPRDDFLTMLAAAEIGGRRLGSADLLWFISRLIEAGHHSTTSAMTSLIYEVFSSPETAEALRLDPAKIPAAVEETLRLRPPFYGFFRRATKPAELHDVPVAASEDVFLAWAAANRDPAEFDAPGQFRLHRDRNRHLTFGLGIHRCVGARLAQLELRLVVEELFRRLPDLSPALDEPVYQFGSGNFAFIPSLPVTFTPAPVM